MIKIPTPNPKHIPVKNLIISMSKRGFEADMKLLIIMAERINKTPLKITIEFFIANILFGEDLTWILK